MRFYPSDMAVGPDAMLTGFSLAREHSFGYFCFNEIWTKIRRFFGRSKLANHIQANPVGELVAIEYGDCR